MKPNALELADNLVLNCTVYTRYAANDELRRLHLIELQFNKFVYKCNKLESELLESKQAAHEAQKACGVLTAQRDKLLETLKTMVDLYCDLVNSGDCGHWDAYSDPKVEQAIKVLEDNH